MKDSLQKASTTLQAYWGNNYINSRQDNDAVFVYLSIDKVFKAWQKASVKEGLDKHAEK